LSVFNKENDDDDDDAGSQYLHEHIFGVRVLPVFEYIGEYIGKGSLATEHIQQR